MEKMEENQTESPFTTLRSEKCHTGRFTIVQDRVRVNGTEQNYDYLEIREGVCILPFHGRKVVLQRQYRYPISSWQWELPGGFVDEGELPEEAARRELKEETGLEAVNLRNLGAFYPSFGSTNEKIHLFSAECGNPGESEKEPGEVLYQEEIAEKTFREMIADGRFMHGAGLAAWARYQTGTPQDSADESRRFVS